ncbi:MAG: UbiA family prenyltransferase [Pseudomonadota bacterium]
MSVGSNIAQPGNPVVDADRRATWSDCRRTDPVDAAEGTDIPLVVDLDGTLLRSDLLIETAFRRAGRDPGAIWGMIRALRRRKACLKRFLSDGADCSPETLPYDADILSIIKRARLAGRKVYLASGSHDAFVGAIARHLDIFDGHFATSGTTNLTGVAKADLLVRTFGRGRFDYIGNDRADLPVWDAARQAIAIRAPRRVAAQLRRAKPEAQFVAHERTTVKDWVRQLRVHQYAKNALVFVPMLAAHAITPANVAIALLVAVAFCMAASACYILNDLIDLQEDRLHRSKRDRPLARGDIPIQHAILAVPVLLIGAAIISISVSWAFAAVLAAYFALTVAYSLYLKRILLIDVLTLAGLYTIRVLGGAVALSIPLSSWLVVFSLSLFVSLALMKRFVELAALIDAGKPSPANRDYEKIDLGMLAALSAAAGFNAVTVLALYVSSGSVGLLYSRPELLLLACPVMTFWIGRALILAQRREMQDDPVLFAIKDPQSRLSGLAMLVVFLVAV